MIELKFAELHNPLFLAGTNLQLKLDPSKRTGLVLKYDREFKELHVYWADEMAIVPTTNVSAMVPVRAGDSRTPAEKVEHKKVEHVRKTAQVGSPMSHVFEGPGAGKTGLEK